jgi:hypothetical protein
MNSLNDCDSHFICPQVHRHLHGRNLKYNNVLDWLGLMVDIAITLEVESSAEVAPCSPLSTLRETRNEKIQK